SSPSSRQPNTFNQSRPSARATRPARRVPPRRVASDDIRPTKAESPLRVNPTDAARGAGRQSRCVAPAPAIGIRGHADEKLMSEPTMARVRANGIELAYFAWGAAARGSGPTLLLA